MKRMLVALSIVFVIALNAAPVSVTAFQSPLDSDPKSGLFSPLPTPVPRSIQYRDATPDAASVRFVFPFVLRVIRMY